LKNPEQHLSVFFRVTLFVALTLVLAPRHSAAQAGFGVVEGIVTRAGTGAPVSDVKVTLLGGPASPQAVRDLTSALAGYGVTVPPPPPGQTAEGFLQSVNEAAAARGVSPFPYRGNVAAFMTANASQISATTDAAGRFRFGNIIPGEYTIDAQREGYFLNSVNNVSPAAARRLTVTPDRTTEALVSLYLGSTIGGRVYGADGTLQANTTVQAFSLIYQNGFPILSDVISKTTDDRGEFRLFWLAGGDYLIAATPRNQPVRMFYPGTAESSAAITVSVKNGPSLDGIDIRLRPVQAAKLSGTVTSTVPPQPGGRGGVAPEVNITMVLAQRDTQSPDTAPPRSVGSVLLNSSSGTFELTGILPGSYELFARVPESNPDGGSGVTYGHIPIEVRGQDVSGLAIEVHPSVRVRGVVVMSGGGAVQGNVRVAVQADGPHAKLPSLVAMDQRSVPLATDGSFMVPAVTAGHFRIWISPGTLPAGLYVSDVRQGPVSVFDSGFDIGGETPAPIQVILNSGTGSIAGSTRDSADRPLAGATVVLVPAAAKRQNRMLYRTTTSDRAGRFTIDGIAPGEYKVFAWESIPAGAYYNAAFLAKHEEDGRSVSVTPSSLTNVTIVPR
jgi:hypothetical protein